MFKRIMACLDGSGLAEQILPYAESQALSFGSTIILFRVVGIPAPAFASGATLAVHAGHMIEEQVQQDETEGKAYLENAAKPLRAKGLMVQCVTMRGDPVGKMIMNYANENAIDLIAISTHGDGGLTRLVFGSVADFLLRNSGLPLLVIKPKEKEVEQ